MDSAERSYRVTLSIIASGLMDGLTPRASYHSRRNSANRKRVKRLLSNKTEHRSGPQSPDKKPSTKEVAESSFRSSVQGRAGYTPSLGSREGSNYSLVSTVVMAAHLAKSSETPFKVY